MQLKQNIVRLDFIHVGSVQQANNHRLFIFSSIWVSTTDTVNIPYVLCVAGKSSFIKRLFDDIHDAPFYLYHTQSLFTLLSYILCEHMNMV